MIHSGLPYVLITLAALALIVGLYRRQRASSPISPSLPTPTGQFESRFTTIDGFRIHYAEAGRGPALVLIHGIGASLYIWRFLMPLAARRYRVVALDLPGFGQSDKRRDADYGLDAQANRVTAFLDQLGVGEACLVGSSMGGTIALWMARQNPRRFSRVVGIAPATQPRLPLVNLSRLRHVPVRAHRWINSRVMKQLLRQVTARPELMTDEAIDQYLRPYRDSGDGTVTFLLATRILQDARLPKALRDVQSSCLILYGMNDRLISLRMMQDLESLIPRAKLLVHPTAGHHSMEDEPDWVMAEIDHIHSS